MVSTKITGARAIVAAKRGSTYGTAVALGAGCRMGGYKHTWKENREKLSTTPIGEGAVMEIETDSGNVAPSGTIQGPLTYDGPIWSWLKCLMGNETTQSLAGGATNITSHSFTKNVNLHAAGHMTYAGQVHSNTNGNFEIPSAAPKKIVFTLPPPAKYAEVNVEWIGNEVKYSGQTNNFDTLDGTTRPSDTKRVIWGKNGKFRINSQSGGALSDSDLVNVEQITITLEEPQESPNEATGTDGNAEAVSTGDYPFIAMIEVQFRSVETRDYWLAAQTGDEFKADILQQGPTVGSYKKGVYFRFPRLKIVEDPEGKLDSAANNGLTVKYSTLLATSVPTGMDSVMPSVVLNNVNPSAY